MPEADAALVADNLTKTFSTGRTGLGRTKVSAVDGVSLSVRRGEALGIVGESGCGKSTLARLLVGLERPDSGTIRFEGRNIARLRGPARRSVRRRIQMVFQDPYLSLNPRLTVADLVAEPLVVHKLARNKAERLGMVGDLLTRVGLTPQMMNRFPHQFSGGQRQRIGIARALAAQPEVLVCDEPVSALDVSVQAQVVNLLRQLQRESAIALVFIAHDLSVVRHVSDRIAVMYLGRLAEVGPAAAVHDQPVHPYTQALLSAIPAVDPSARGRLARRILLPGDPPSPAAPPSGCRFHTRCRLASDVCAKSQPPMRAERLGALPVRDVACHHADLAAADAASVR